MLPLFTEVFRFRIPSDKTLGSPCVSNFDIVNGRSNFALHRLKLYDQRITSSKRTKFDALKSDSIAIDTNTPDLPLRDPRGSSVPKELPMMVRYDRSWYGPPGGCGFGGIPESGGSGGYAGVGLVASISCSIEEAFLLLALSISPVSDLYFEAVTAYLKACGRFPWYEQDFQGPRLGFCLQEML